MNKATPFLLLCALLGGGSPPLAAEPPAEALGGFDPVLLTEGRDVLGSEELTLEHGGLLYYFATSETRARFVAEPQRYGVQLGGSCARMGPGAAGHPDLFTVHRGKIYLFGTEECQRAFEASPERYVPPDPAPWAPTDDARRRGAELLDRIARGLGLQPGEAGPATYRERGEIDLGRGEAARSHAYTLSVAFPAHWREERVFPWGTLTTVIRPEGSFQLSPQGRQALRPVYRADVVANLVRRDALALVRARSLAGCDVALSGGSDADGAAGARAIVACGDQRTELVVDAASGRLLRLAFVGRDPASGVVGRLVRTFSDYRTVGRLSLPFQRVDTLDGETAAVRTVRVAAIELDPALPEGAFEAGDGAGNDG